MDRFEAMRALIAAVDGGSLTAAARGLSIPLPTISRRVSDLEAHLGAQLVVRTSRKLVLTEAGDAFVAAARKLIEDLDDAERAASGEYSAPRGELLVTAPIMFGKAHVAPIVHEFLDAYPDVTVRLVLADHVIDLVEAHVDVAVRIGQLPDSDLVARRVGQVRWVICASPEYIERRGEPTSPSDLAAHACVAFEGLQTYRGWSFASEAGAETASIRPRFSVNTADAVIEAASAGVGIARVRSYQAAAAIRSKTLVPLLRAHAPAPAPVQLVYRAHRGQPLKQRAFLDYLTPRLRIVLDEIEAVFA
jgi:DNA-binding transcriptional LysR family regulator